MKEREKLISGDMNGLFLKLAMPGMIAMIIVGLYNFVDAIFVGRLVGKEAVGAVAILYSVVLLNQAILTLVGSGSMSILSIAIGKKDQKTINKLLGNMSIFIIIFSGLLSILVYIFGDSIVTLVGGKGDIHELALRYLKILLIGFIPAALAPAMNFLVRAEGKMMDAMILGGIAGILNIILDPIFIGVLGLGIEGAAIATVISQFVYLICQIVYFKSGRSVITLKEAKFKLEKDIMPRVCKIGSAQMIMCAMAMVQQILLFRALGKYGGNGHVSLMGATYKIFMFAYLAIWGLGQGLQPIVGVNYGAKNYKRVKEAFRKFTLMGLPVSGACWILFMIFPKVVLSWFIKDPALVNEGVNLFRLFNVLFFSYIYFSTLINLFMGAEKPKQAGMLAITRQIVFFVPLIIILPIFMGVTGVWISIPIADLLSMGLGFYFKQKLFKDELSNELGTVEQY